ncbi:MAG TPA: hypothetical protein VJ978_03565 [Nitriliruptoraceae bacterium]|nr:hypothetical protein [Nitriliruptoraceae bacterium]
MTATTTTQPRPARRLGVATLASVLLGAGLATASAPAQAAPAQPLQPQGVSQVEDCDLTLHASKPWVECVVTDSGAITFGDLVPEHLLPNPGTDVIMTARGGDGATLTDPLPDLRGGPGGAARTIVATDDIDQVHVHIGRNAADGSREGGSSTVVAPVAMDHVTSIEDTWLVAGGGGAQGARINCKGRINPRSQNQGAGSGGRGGTADATRTDGDATAAGWNGGRGMMVHDCKVGRAGHPGTGADRGVAGVNNGDPRSNGIDGVGGHGGDNGWQGNVAPDHLPGRGGVTSVYAMGGGGWGGGGGGERNGGGGGGGSFARAATTHLDLTDIHLSSPSVTIAWPMPAISTVVANSDGDGTITVTRPDGTLLCGDVTSCEASVTPGSQLVVTATPDSIADLIGFDGDCDVHGNVCTTTHQPGQHVTANFHTPTVPITIQVTFEDQWFQSGWVEHDRTRVCGPGAGGTTCTVQVPERELATLHAIVDHTVTELSHWSGACTGTDPACTIDPAGHPTATAHFVAPTGGGGWG